MDQKQVNQIEQNLLEVQQRITAAAAKSGRDENQIQLIAITKYVGNDEIGCLLDLGCTKLGESRPQQLWDKAAFFADQSVDWHMIGNLQRNKAKRTVPLVSLLHSGNSIRLLKTVNDLASPTEPLHVLLEVNVSGDEAKHGFTAEQLPEVMQQVLELSNIRVKGLMGMAARDGDNDQARRNFSTLRQLRDQFRENSPENVQLDELSMGMSRDFEIAIEEGATMVRVGSGLFKEL
ncbi:MAG: YggS family pyridoxal phosphate-dependent enzyme [Blastopirellula sp.]|nr:MAG: YggS family pyridoxal phosphate-dependent enzyme [Blastopirellula sp.]